MGRWAVPKTREIAALSQDNSQRSRCAANSPCSSRSKPNRIALKLCSIYRNVKYFASGGGCGRNLVSQNVYHKNGQVLVARRRRIFLLLLESTSRRNEKKTMTSSPSSGASSSTTPTAAFRPVVGLLWLLLSRCPRGAAAIGTLPGPYPPFDACGELLPMVQCSTRQHVAAWLVTYILYWLLGICLG